MFDDSRQLEYKSIESLIIASTWDVLNAQIINYIITSTFPDTISDLYRWGQMKSGTTRIRVNNHKQQARKY